MRVVGPGALDLVGGDELGVEVLCEGSWGGELELVEESACVGFAVGAHGDVAVNERLEYPPFLSRSVQPFQRVLLESVAILVGRRSDRKRGLDRLQNLRRGAA